MVRDFLVVQMSNARDERMMTTGLCPDDRIMLRFCVVEDIVCMVLDHIMRNRLAIAAFRPRFNENVGHFQPP